MKSIRSVAFLSALFSVSVLAAEDYVVTVGVGDEDVVWSEPTGAGPAALVAGGVLDRTLVKKGGGRLIIACSLKSLSYKGTIKVSEGYLQLRHDGACGTSAGGVVVESGATLEGDSTYKSGGLAFNSEALTFGGFGVNGTEGALKMIGNGTWNFFEYGRKTMTEDTLLNGAGRLDIRFGTFDMGGHTLYASNYVPIVGANITNPGKIVCRRSSSEGGAFSLESNTKFNGSAENELVFDGQTAFVMKAYSGTSAWTMALSNTVKITTGYTDKERETSPDTAAKLNRWDGPVYIAQGKRLYASGSEENYPKRYIVNINGKISGPGGVAAIYPCGYLRLKYPENDFTGNVTVQSSALIEAACLGSLGKGSLTIDSGGTVRFLYSGMGDFTMTDAEFERMQAKKRGRWSDLATKTLWTGYYSQTDDYFWSDPVFSFEGVPDFTYNKDISDGKNIYHEETNTLTLAGTVTGRPRIINTRGKLVLSGSGVNETAGIFVRDGTVEIASGTTVSLGSYTWKLNGAYPATPRLVVGENAVLANIDSSQYALPVNYIGGSLGSDAMFDYMRGVFEVRSGAVVTNLLGVGGTASADSSCTNGTGAVYLRGQLVVRGNNSRDAFRIGSNADGYLEIGEGGYFDASAGSCWILVGRRNGKEDNPGHAVVHVDGGRMIQNSIGFAVNDGGGFGHLRLSSGALSNNTLIVGKSLYANKSGGEGVVTVEGGDLHVAGRLQLGGISNSVSVVNVNGGTLSPAALQVITDLTQISGGSQQAPCSFVDADNPVYVNFNGGTYAPTIENQAYSWLTPSVTRYTVFSGGATVDCGSCDRQFKASFKAPEGKGVKEVAFSCDEPWRYIGAPYVRIVDPAGEGYGATAVADFDSQSGLVNGVTVTSPGCNYTEGTYAEISFGGWTNTLHAAVTLSDNDLSGGFTKKGAGTVTLAETNHWHGITRVQEGKLELSVADGLPNTCGIHVDGGAEFDSCGFALPSGSLSGTGCIKGDFVLSGTLTVDAADLLAKRYLTVEGSLLIMPGAKLVVLNAGLLQGETPRFRAVTASGGVSGTIELDRASLPDERHSIYQTSEGVYFRGLRGMAITIK